MYLTYIIYALCIALILWGSRFAGFRGKFHDDFMSIETTKSLRGLAALGVILHHISQEQPFQKVGETSFFVTMGPLFVALFFFCSGFGLLKNMNEKPDYLNGFLKKRVIKGLVIPFYVNVLLYAVFNLVVGIQLAPLRWVTNFLGLTLMNGYAWFPIVLFLIYVAFYLIFKNIENRKLCLFLMFLVIIGQGVFFCISGHFAWWASERFWFSGQWWVNSSIALLIGMLFANNEKKIVTWYKKGYWLKLLLALVVWRAFCWLSIWTQTNFGYYTEYTGKGSGIGDKLITYLSEIPQITFFVIVIFAIMMKFNNRNYITRFFGTYSLDTYLMNLIPICLFRFLEYDKFGPVYKAGNYNLAIYAVAVIVTSILLGLLERWIINKVCKMPKWNHFVKM